MLSSSSSRYLTCVLFVEDVSRSIKARGGLVVVEMTVILRKDAVWEDQVIACWVSSERYEASGNLWARLQSYSQRSSTSYLNSVKGVHVQIDVRLCWSIDTFEPK